MYANIMDILYIIIPSELLIVATGPLRSGLRPDTQEGNNGFPARTGIGFIRQVFFYCKDTLA